jgi:glycosyltransferase involved in cell wall biosynthesis
LTCALVRERRPGALPLRLVNALSLPGRLRALARRGQLIACSSYLARTLVEAGAPAERVSVLHPVPPEPAQPMQPRPRERRLLVAAQLVHGKGVDLAIHALRFLPDDISLNVVGDGPDRARLERLALPFGRRVKFDGYVPAERMQAMYDSCRAALVPSRWPEPFGLCGVEAMRRARPAVGAAHGGILEWLAPGAGFVPENVHDLARAALEALDDDTAGDRSLGFVRTRFPEGGAVQAAESALAAAASSSTAAP